MRKAQREAILAKLEETYKGSKTALNYNSPFELLVAVILSAQCTDERVNVITARMFPRLNTPEKMGALTQEEMEAEIRDCGLYHAKAKNLLGMCHMLTQRFNSVIPNDIKTLMELPGVGQKTANVIASIIYNIPALAVDTHVFRVSHRLGLAKGKDPLATEKVEKNTVVMPIKYTNGKSAGNVTIDDVASAAQNDKEHAEFREHFSELDHRVDNLGSRVDKVGAGAAALAALHPMDFDPDDKLTFAAGYGNYKGRNAAAVGAFYRPDEKVMLSVGGTFGNGENMVNAGISFSLDRTARVSNSRTAMAKEIVDLRANVANLTALVGQLTAGMGGTIEMDRMKLFPDVPENHWAYEYIGRLAAAGIVEGYPDGMFNGNRMMSRYEFAAMLYRALEKGVKLDHKLVREFEPEMGRIHVARISGADGDRGKIERVRVYGGDNRDHYGSKLN